MTQVGSIVSARIAEPKWIARYLEISEFTERYLQESSIISLIHCQKCYGLLMIVYERTILSKVLAGYS